MFHFSPGLPVHRGKRKEKPLRLGRKQLYYLVTSQSKLKVLLVRFPAPPSPFLIIFHAPYRITITITLPDLTLSPFHIPPPSFCGISPQRNNSSLPSYPLPSGALTGLKCDISPHPPPPAPGQGSEEKSNLPRPTSGRDVLVEAPCTLPVDEPRECQCLCLPESLHLEISLSSSRNGPFYTSS